MAIEFVTTGPTQNTFLTMADMTALVQTRIEGIPWDKVKDDIMRTRCLLSAYRNILQIKHRIRCHPGVWGFEPRGARVYGVAIVSHFDRVENNNHHLLAQTADLQEAQFHEAIACSIKFSGTGYEMRERLRLQGARYERMHDLSVNAEQERRYLAGCITSKNAANVLRRFFITGGSMQEDPLYDIAPVNRMPYYP
jgi:hypothetical protein